MTARTCWTCAHLLTCRHIGYAHGTLYLEAAECDFEGVAVPCNESGVCGRWSAREGEEEEEE